MCVCTPTTAGLGLFFLSSFFLILILSTQKTRSINRGVSTEEASIFILLFLYFRSLIIYSSAERRRDNEVISMSLTVKSKPSLLLLILVLRDVSSSYTSSD